MNLTILGRGLHNIVYSQPTHQQKSTVWYHSNSSAHLSLSSFNSYLFDVHLQHPYINKTSDSGKDFTCFCQHPLKMCSENFRVQVEGHNTSIFVSDFALSFESREEEFLLYLNHKAWTPDTGAMNFTWNGKQCI